MGSDGPKVQDGYGFCADCELCGDIREQLELIEFAVTKDADFNDGTVDRAAILQIVKDLLKGQP